MICLSSGKVCYENRAAVAAAHKALSAGRRRQKLHPYHCHVCGKWHLGRRLEEITADGNNSNKRARRRARGSKT